MELAEKDYSLMKEKSELTTYKSSVAQFLDVRGQRQRDKEQALELQQQQVFSQKATESKSLPSLGFLFKQTFVPIKKDPNFTSILAQKNETLKQIQSRGQRGQSVSLEKLLLRGKGEDKSRLSVSSQAGLFEQVSLEAQRKKLLFDKRGSLSKKDKVGKGLDFMGSSLLSKAARPKDAKPVSNEQQILIANERIKDTEKFIRDEEARIKQFKLKEVGRLVKDVLEPVSHINKQGLDLKKLLNTLFG